MYYNTTCISPCTENTNERPKAPPRDEPHITPSPMRLCAMRLCRVLRGRGATRRGSALRYPDTVDSERRSGSEVNGAMVIQALHSSIRSGDAPAVSTDQLTNGPTDKRTNGHVPSIAPQPLSDRRCGTMPLHLLVVPRVVEKDLWPGCDVMILPEVLRHRRAAR